MMFYNNSLADNLALDTRKNAATEADHAAERKIVPLIQSDYPQDSIVSEEDKSQLNARIQKDGYTWIIDPLDGTNNFVNQIPFFCSSVAVMKDRKPFIGVIYEPVLNQVYYAIQGMHSQVWRVSTGETRLLQADRQVQTLSESLLATHISARAPVTRELFDDKFFLNLSLNFKHVRSFGSGLLALAYVAVGRLNTLCKSKVIFGIRLRV
jgi:fructose-1,6-bisphosphatase/inositol monophosphatase family enzyme